MIFPYIDSPAEETSPADGDVIYRPMVKLHVIGLSGMGMVWALLDTGADGTVFPLAMAGDLGVTLTDNHTIIKGYGGQESAVIDGELDLAMSDGKETVQWTASVGFAVLADSENEMMILGHQGCLEYFRATFDGQKRHVEIVPTSDFPGTVQRG